MSYNSLQVLMTADIHFNNRLPHSKPMEDGVSDRMRDQLNVFCQMVDYAVEHEIEHLFVLGDVWDKSTLDAVTLRHTMEVMVSAAPLNIWILPGNHDLYSAAGYKSFATDVYGVLEKEHIHYMETGRPIELESWLKLWPMEYMKLEEAAKTLGDIRENLDDDAFNYLMMHQSVLGCTHGGWVCDDGLEPHLVCGGWDYVFSGHFHDVQHFGDNGRYLGAPMQHHFGDVGRDRGFWKITFKEDRPEPQMGFILSEAPRFWKTAKPRMPRRGGDYPQAGDYIWAQAEMDPTEWAKKRHAWEAWAEEQKDFHISIKFKPKRDVTAARMEVKPEETSAKDAISKYINVAAKDLEPSKIDFERLKQVGYEILEEVEAEARERLG